MKEGLRAVLLFGVPQKIEKVKLGFMILCIMVHSSQFFAKVEEKRFLFVITFHDACTCTYVALKV